MDKKLVILILLFFLILGTFSISVFTTNRARRARADNPPPPSQSKSFVLAYSNGTECIVNPVVRGDDENGIVGITVEVTSTFGTVSPVSSTTNESGISENTVTSSTQGIGQITAIVNGSMQISTQVSCEFSP